MTNLNFFKIVFNDLCYLRDNWNDRINSEAIRVTGTILRRLIVDNYLLKVCYEISPQGQLPCFEVTDVDSIAGNFTSDEIEIILSGSAEYGGKLLKNIMLIKGNRKLLGTPLITVPLNKFNNTTCIQIKHIKINNQELIRYMCNKLGSAHFDNRRKNNKTENKFKLLDHLLENRTWLNIDIMGLDPVRFQFLSIGQIINRSNDIKIFIDKLKNILKV